MHRALLLIGALLAAAWPAAAGAAPREVTVMTFNIASAVETGNDLDPIADAIELRDPDIVGLQEVDRSWSRSDSLDQASELALRLGMSFRFDPNVDCSSLDFDNDGVCRYGTAILSRLPLRAAAGRDHPLPLAFEQDEPRGLAQVGVTVRGRRLTVFNTHLSAHHSSRMLQVRSLLGILATVRPPYVVLGDFNSAPGSAEVRLLRSRLVDTAKVAGVKRPTVGNMRIDYVFASPGLKVLRAFVPSIRSRRVSDHRPLVVRLRF